MITGPCSNDAEESRFILKKPHEQEEFQITFFEQELEDLLYGFNMCMNYSNALLEFQDFEDNFFHGTKTLLTDLVQLLNKSLKSKENVTIMLNKSSLEDLLMALDLVLYMNITQIKSPGYCHQCAGNTIRDCCNTFLGLQKRIKNKLV